MAEDKNETTDGVALDLSGLGGFDFTPAWAKGKADDKARFSRFEAREERGERADRGGGRRGPRPPSERGERSEHRRGPREDRPQRTFVKPLDVDVRILPNQKELGTIIRQIQTSGLAYSVKQLALFFLDHPEACLLRLSPREGSEVHFHQCKACGHVEFSEKALEAHILSGHLADYYDVEEIDCEPPKGVFTCVARCGLSGVLLGPPNLHGYDARIRDVLRTKFPGMSEEAFRARIEMVRDAETVEAWRQSATKKTIFRRKPVEGAAEAADGVAAAPALDREAAEFEFRRTIAANLMTTPKTVDLTAEAALKSSDRSLVFACRDALNWERKRPRDLFRALHGAFHHRKLEFFRANGTDGPEFVVAVKPTALDVAHAIPELGELVKYVAEHPDQLKSAVVSALAGGDKEKATAVQTHLTWLVAKGHLVNYSMGLLAIPEEHPRYRPPPRKRAKPAAESAPAAEAPAEPVAAESAPAAEAPAEPAVAESAPAAEAPAEPAVA
ncbi:MAG: hypothetical protein ACI4Q3_08340, partial [Kiritimatiellia bacterium]